MTEIPGTNAIPKCGIDEQIREQKREISMRERMLFKADNEPKREEWRRKIDLARAILMTLTQVKEMHHTQDLFAPITDKDVPY